MVDLKLVRNCPACNKDIFYSRKYTFKRAEKEHRLCSSCCLIGNSYTKGKCPINKGIFSEPIKKSIDNGFIWKICDVWYRNCPSCKKPTKCSSSYNAYKRINENCHSCGNLKNVGSKRSYESKKKMSISAIKRIQKYQLYNKPNFNPIACKFIDELNSLVGINLQHALNGGEVWIHGFYPDGYDKNKNIIFEYDESWHRSVSAKTRDLQRQKIILEKTNPTMFLRYDEKTDTLCDVISNEKF